MALEPVALEDLYRETVATSKFLEVDLGFKQDVIHICP